MKKVDEKKTEVGWHHKILFAPLRFVLKQITAKDAEYAEKRIKIDELMIDKEYYHKWERDYWEGPRGGPIYSYTHLPIYCF
jgi:hypothetical protein